MDIILKNYKKLIESILKDFLLSKVDSSFKSFAGLNNINNYIYLISSFDEALCYSF